MLTKLLTGCDNHVLGHTNKIKHHHQNNSAYTEDNHTAYNNNYKSSAMAEMAAQCCKV